MSLFHEATLQTLKLSKGVEMTRDGVSYPFSAGEPRYGMTSFNHNKIRLGVSNAHPSLYSFNSGCVNMHGCVNNGGFSCAGRLASMSPLLSSSYDAMNATYAPSSFDLFLPSNLVKYR